MCQKMPKYNFYYDESEHSRKISYTTISASNYYDNFITMIVGWSDEEANILQRYGLPEMMIFCSFTPTLKLNMRTGKIAMVKSKVQCFDKNNLNMVSLLSTDKTLNLYMIFCHFLIRIFTFTFPFPVRLNILYYNFSRITETIFSLMQI